MGVIYVRPNLINGKKYVGQATNLKKRQSDWKCLTQKYAGTAINNARAKYGIDNFGFEILKECDDKELDYWEKYYIKVLNTKAPYGYNLTDGGDGLKGYSPSEETRKKLSEARKGITFSEETKKKMSDARKGIKLSEETKKKMSDARKGIKLSEETKKKMSDARKGIKRSEEAKKKISETLKGRKPSEETRRKISEARKGIKRSEETKKKISETLKGRKPSEETRRKISEARKGIPNIKLSKPVLQIDKNTDELIAEFPSMTEVERQLGFSFKNISACCLGKIKSAYGFKWKYKEESVA